MRCRFDAKLNVVFKASVIVLSIWSSRLRLLSRPNWTEARGHKVRDVALGTLPRNLTECHWTNGQSDCLGPHANEVTQAVAKTTVLSQSLLSVTG